MPWPKIGYNASQVLIQSKITKAFCHHLISIEEVDGRFMFDESRLKRTQKKARENISLYSNMYYWKVIEYCIDRMEGKVEKCRKWYQVST